MPVNTNVFTGADADLLLAVDQPDSVEGKLAQDLIESFEVGIVGRASDVSIVVTNDLRAYHEIGARLPAQLHAGNINITGKIGRAYLNGALLRLLLGDYGKPNNEADPLPEPTFNLLMTIFDRTVENSESILTVHGVKFENWSFVTPEDDFVMEAVSFRGKFITVDDIIGT
jgi:hypothetical protein